LGGVDGAGGTLAWRGPGDHRPGLRQQVDPTLVVRRRAERRSVVIVGTPIPLAVPASRLERRLDVGAVGPVPPRPLAIPALFAERNELAGDEEEEETEPDALALPFPADAVHPVVPVARAHKRQAVRPARERAVECATAVRVHVGGLARGLRQEILLVLARLERGSVLELVAKAERAARLIERRPPPQAAGERLVEEPAVRHEIEAAARCLHLDRGQRRLPVGAHLIQSLVERSRLPIARDERSGRAGIGRLTEKE